MGRSTVHYTDTDTNNILKKLHNKLRPAGTPVQRVEYIIELLLLRIFEVKLKQEPDFKNLRDLFTGQNEDLLFSSLYTIANDRLLGALNDRFFPFYASILFQARKVYQTNLSQKVQDQLVLIEEVFKNSNFTNNVKSGNLHEILGLISEIDEGLILKSDLLGDAIESALSETGGTKDIGLHRTPDHIRQFMTAIVAPTFEDNIFDPACGTAGFLFDGFGYVIESVNQAGNWPGSKAHPELQAYFKAFFAGHKAAMPSLDTTTTFHRTGISGIEYLGMIRKMAAINFYVRGLNPQNIEQGDSLALFNPVDDGGSKTVVLANPPFGAQRDQDAYPNVWEEYPRESETTILFVKLMLDSLAPGGRCAVVVSEGFLSWDQTSARALRKLLLETADLRAIISLPQGVFVSKGGVGPKTSILVFYKGGPARDVWFYKVANDGYSMGTNRRPIEGCQLVEALDIYDKYVRKGITPPETRHSFSIPSDWILALDPRIKRRIETETTAEFTAKAEKEREKLIEKLENQIKEEKITRQDMEEKLVQHDEIWKNKTLNEIAKRIERAHAYSFNLAGYRSSLSRRQLAEWAAVFDGKGRGSGGSLDTRFAALEGTELENAHDVLASLDVQNALEFDIARQYLTGFPVESLEKHNQLATLRKIIESGAKYPRVRLGDYLRLNTDRIKPSDFPATRFRVLGVSNTNGVFLNETKSGADIKQAYHRVKPGEFCYNPYRVNVGSIGLNPFDYDHQIISGAYTVFGTDETELVPEYLMTLFKSPQFLAYVNEKAHGGVRMNFKFEDLADWEIPLPKLETQRSVSLYIDHNIKYLNCLSQSVLGWSTDFYIDLESKPVQLYKLCCVASTVVKDLSEVSGLPYVGGENITSYSGTLTSLHSVSELGIKGPAFRFYPGQVMYAKIRPALSKCFLANFKGVCSSDIYPLEAATEHIMPEYLYAILASKYFAGLASQFDQRAGIPKINREQLYSITVPVPSLERQNELMQNMQKDISVVQGLRNIINKIEREMDRKIEQVWSE